MSNGKFENYGKIGNFRRKIITPLDIFAEEKSISIYVKSLVAREGEAHFPFRLPDLR